MKFLGVYVGNKTQNKILFWTMILITLVLIVLIHWKRPPQEGFSQGEKYVIRRDLDIYDVFLAQIYDMIYQPKPMNQSIFDMVEKLTMPSKTQSVLLDAGCGTGELVSYIQSKGYTQAYGLDNSPDMITECTDKYPDLPIKQGNLNDPMTYDKNIFTHILMTGNTMYHFPDKVTLFRNLYYWLIPHGFLVIQLYDRDKFDPIPATGKPLLVDSLQNLVRTRVTDSVIHFPDFTYKSSYDFSKAAPQNTVLFQESFQDAHTKHVRQNEWTMYMEPLDEIVYMAQYAGFLVHGQVNLKEANQDEHQYIFILQRPH
jgi:SAM-dependent methyltransferase